MRIKKPKKVGEGNQFCLKMETQKNEQREKMLFAGKHEKLCSSVVLKNRAGMGKED